MAMAGVLAVARRKEASALLRPDAHGDDEAADGGGSDASVPGVSRHDRRMGVPAVDEPLSGWAPNPGARIGERGLADSPAPNVSLPSTYMDGTAASSSW